MKLRLFKQTEPAEEHIDIYYQQMSQPLEHIIAVINNTVPRIEGKLEDERVFLLPSTIYYVETVDRRTFLYTKQEVYQTEGSLTQLEELYGHFGFVRVNKSQLVNYNHIKSITSTAGMRIIAKMNNGENLVINRSFRNNFLEELKTAGGRPHEKMDN